VSCNKTLLLLFSIFGRSDNVCVAATCTKAQLQRCYSKLPYLANRDNENSINRDYCK